MPAVLGLASGPSHARLADAASQDIGPDSKGRLNTILQRNVAAGRAMDTRLWRALCDEPASATAFMAQDVVWSSVLTPADGDGVVAALERMPPLLSYRFHSLKVVQIGLMAVAVIYHVTVSRRAASAAGDRRKKGEVEDLEMIAQSSWRQTAGADWELCGHSAGFAD